MRDGKPALVYNYLALERTTPGASSNCRRTTYGSRSILPKGATMERLVKFTGKIEPVTFDLR